MKYLLALLLVVEVISSYDTRLSKQLVYMSQIAFNSIENINKWSCSSCKHYNLTDIKAFTNSSLMMQGFVGYSQSNNAVIVSFRGSDNTKNWIDDFDFLQMPYMRCTGCLVHNGFYFGYLSISSLLKSQVELILSKYRGASIYVTGHSLGGALATVAALDLKHTYNVPMKVYTYGQPRVGNGLYANYFKNQIPDAYRVIHNADAVPHLPPIAFDYKHYEKQIWYSPDMQSFKQCTAQDKSCADSFSPQKLIFNDHDIGTYMKLPVISEPFSLRNQKSI